ncbi:hypothetical protein Klosneuvirus_3_158 [Klosneuvirus KNV1]|uniref:Uncharacterized protein n=1 Tax=Klosneuvirus KNV1 TaxID=1977640 RepID=A0A1V0SJY9_9VIRU|nr:hypothetical protein Klosneuvirus_3_158 [Klosneuvirus KNV1]
MLLSIKKLYLYLLVWSIAGVNSLILALDLDRLGDKVDFILVDGQVLLQFKCHEEHLLSLTIVRRVAMVLHVFMRYNFVLAPFKAGEDVIFFDLLNHVLPSGKQTIRPKTISQADNDPSFLTFEQVGHEALKWVKLFAVVSLWHSHGIKEYQIDIF